MTTIVKRLHITTRRIKRSIEAQNEYVAKIFLEQRTHVRFAKVSERLPYQTRRRRDDVKDAA